MKLVDRYIIKEIVSAFIASTVIFTSILAGSTILFQIIGDIVRYDIPINQALQLLVLKTNILFALSFPMGTLLSTIFVFGKLNSDSEIIAFRSCGIHFIRIARPVFIIGFIISLLTIWFNETIVPHAEHKSENIIASFKSKNKPTIKENINLTEYKNNKPHRIINVPKIEAGILKDITLVEFEDGVLNQLIRANYGQWLPSGGWELNDGILHHFPAKHPNTSNIIRFKSQKINITINPFNIQDRSKRNEEMSINELRNHIQRKQSTGQDVIKDWMDFHMRFALPFASFIFTIIGTSVGLRPQRSSSAQSLGLSFIIILCYYILMAVGMGLGLSKTIHPIIAVWLPNIIIATIGIGYQRHLIRI